MSRAWQLALQAVDRVFPVLLRGPHHLARERQRRAYLLGFEAGFKAASRE